MKYKYDKPIDNLDKFKKEKVFVLKTYKRYNDSSHFFELSGQRMICPKHGFQYDTESKITAHDMFGGAMHFAHLCKKCGNICSEEKGTDFEIVEYVNDEWRREAELKEMHIVPFDDVEVQK